MLQWSTTGVSSSFSGSSKRSWLFIRILITVLHVGEPKCSARSQAAFKRSLPTLSACLRMPRHALKACSGCILLFRRTFMTAITLGPYFSAQPMNRSAFHWQNLCLGGMCSSKVEYAPFVESRMCEATRLPRWKISIVLAVALSSTLCRANL